MGFNVDKCSVLTITKKRNRIIHPYTLHQQHLERVQSAKYLGVEICHNLSWRKHAETVVSKANRASAFVTRNWRAVLNRFKPTASGVWSARCWSMLPPCGTPTSSTSLTRWNLFNVARLAELSGILAQLPAARSYFPDLTSPCLALGARLTRPFIALYSKVALLTWR